MQSIPARDQPGQRVRRRTRARSPGRPPRAPRRSPPTSTSSGHSGARSPTAAVDPVADQLDPAVAARGLLGDRLRAAAPGRRARRPARGCSAWAGPRCRPARMISGRSARPCSGRVSIGEPQSRISSVPASRSVRACSSASSRSAPPPSGPSPTWQCASTSPGTIQPPSTRVSAPGTGSALTSAVGVDVQLDGARSLGQQHAAQPVHPQSRCGYFSWGTSASTGRSRAAAGPARRPAAARAGRRQARTGRACRRSRPAARPPRAGPRPAGPWRPSCPCGPWPACVVALRPPRSRTGPAICFIILRASKNRLTRSLTSLTATPEPLAMRSRRDPLMIFGSARSAGVMPRMIACSLSSCRSSTCASASFIWPALAPGQHAEDVADRPHLADREHLLEEVLQRQLAGADLGRGLAPPARRRRPARPARSG